MKRVRLSSDKIVIFWCEASLNTYLAALSAVPIFGRKPCVWITVAFIMNLQDTTKKIWVKSIFHSLFVWLDELTFLHIFKFHMDTLQEIVRVVKR